MTIGKRIKLRRNQLRLTQTQLADMVLSSQRQILKYEQNENSPTAAVIISLAMALDVSADWLLGLSEDINPRYEESSLRLDEQRLLKIYRAKTPEKQESILSVVQAI
jgi:transcriptional regulator with XRE-family HTH domain